MRKLDSVLLVVIFAFTFFSGCKEANKQTSADPWNTDRPHDPWVFRSVLDVQPRMLTLALDDNLWAAYSAANGSLYKVWKGNVNFDGAVYTTAHGPQPTSIGDAYFINAHNEPWFVIEGGQERPVKSLFKGHRFANGHVALLSEIDLGNGKLVQVTEQPEYLEKEGAQVGFERIFTTSGVPENMQLGLLTNVSSIALQNQLTSDGELQIVSTTPREKDGVKGMDLEAKLLLKSNAATNLTSWFVKHPLIENPNKIKAPEEEGTPLGEQLIAQNDCKTCHNTLKQTIGPAYMDVAKKYANNEENVVLLSGKVTNGGSGVWGEQVMNPHPVIPQKDVRAMVEYILSLDEEEEKNAAKIAATDLSNVKFSPAAEVSEEDLFPGVAVRVFVYKNDLTKLADIDQKQTPTFAGIIPMINAEGGDFKGLEDDFAFIIKGYLNIKKDNRYDFSLVSDDGSRLTIDDKVVIDHDGLHGSDAKNGQAALAAGYHPFMVEFFQGKGGKYLALNWKNAGDNQYSLIPATSLVHHKKDKPEGGTILPMATEKRIPGDGYPLEEVHPSYDLSQARPDNFTPKVGGMDFLSDGRMVVSTWDPAGSVFILDGVETGDPAKITVKTIAKGFAEPLGLKVVDDEIYVLQKQELTKLIDLNDDEIIDEYRTVCNGWKVSANFHEFAFGLAYKDGYFYGSLATAILPGGASAQPQIPDRGKVVKISKADGSFEFVSQGLRTPNGIGLGVDDEIFVGDNQGDWLPASKILHVRPGAWFGSHSVDPIGTANLQEALPMVWLPQDEIGNSPSTPLALNDGPYKGQMIHGEVTHGGVKRVFVEKINGEYQGCVFRFIQGLEAGVNRMVWGPDGALYVGGVGAPGNWGQSGKLWYGLQRLKYNGKPTFEMLALRAKSDGVEIEFTEALPAGEGWDAADYLIKQWWYQPTENYGGPKMEEELLKIKSVNVSADRKKVFLELNGMKPGHLVYLQLQNSPISDQGHELWSTEAWYTMNNIPANTPGMKTTRPAPLAFNTLTDAEKAAGWRLLFDGKTLNGWRTFKKQTIGSSWVVQDDAIMLNAVQAENGDWQSKDGGDIITNDQFENYELSLEWKISNCGNSGVIFNVNEGDDFQYVWQTGPEMQILDNTCHPDGKFIKHRAGDLYDLIACKYVTVMPAGAWNKARLIINNGHLEQWLNGHKVVETELWNEAWDEMVKHSKFAEMPAFAKFKKGHISLQDHGNRVWFRNIKIKELKKES